MGAGPAACHHCHTGRCPVGITTQDPEVMKRVDIDEAADRVANFINSMTMEMQMLARACGKSNIHDLVPEDLRALTLEASFISGIPVVGTNLVFGRPDLWPQNQHGAGTYVAGEQYDGAAHANSNSKRTNGTHDRKNGKKHSSEVTRRGSSCRPF